jgi:hypothetical protein
MAIERRNLERVQRAKGDHTEFFERHFDAALLEMVTALLAEVCVLRDRLDSHERLLGQNAPVSRESVDDYQPDALSEQERRAVRMAILDNVMKPLRDRLVPDEIKRLNRDYQTILEEVQRPA